MLYDKRWEKKVEADPLSLDALIAWLEMQPAATNYDYCDISSCLIARYLRDIGAPRIQIQSDELHALGLAEVVHPTDGGEWTYRAALDRARSLRRASEG